MDQQKIGRFIAACRKQQHLTQAQLAEALGITDRAVSKWETGRSLPDTALMLELCEVLHISVNDLLHGEVIAMSDYNQKQEELVLELARQKERTDKQLLTLEIVIGIFSIMILLGFCVVAAFVPMADWLRVVLILVGFLIGVIGIMFALRIEQTAGYYKCRACGHTYVPTFRQVLWAMHFGRTRYMRCPKCHQSSWQKKTIGKD